MQKISNEKKNIRDVGSGQLSTKISIFPGRDYKQSLKMDTLAAKK